MSAPTELSATDEKLASGLYIPSKQGLQPIDSSDAAPAAPPAEEAPEFVAPKGDVGVGVPPAEAASKYEAPDWGKVPPKGYSLEINKAGVLLGTIPLKGKDR